MSNINYQALREVAEAAKGKTTWQKLQAFHAEVTPEVVLALLDRLERRPEPEAIMQHVFYSLLSQGKSESEAMYAVMRSVEPHIQKMDAYTEALLCVCTKSGGAFMHGNRVTVFMVELSDSYGLPRIPFYWTEVEWRNAPLVLAHTKEGFVDEVTGATFHIV